MSMMYMSIMYIMLILSKGVEVKTFWFLPGRHQRNLPGYESDKTQHQD